MLLVASLYVCMYVCMYVRTLNVSIKQLTLTPPSQLLAVPEEGECWIHAWQVHSQVENLSVLLRSNSSSRPKDCGPSSSPGCNWWRWPRRTNTKNQESCSSMDASAVVRGSVPSNSYMSSPYIWTYFGQQDGGEVGMGGMHYWGVSYRLSTASIRTVVIHGYSLLSPIDVFVANMYNLMQD